MDNASRLILFADVIDNGSFSHAAKLRNINRSIVSKQIARLEQDLGLRLLHRTTRSLSMTDAGRSIYQHARTIRHQLLETDALVDSIRADISGELRISSTTHFGRLHVMPVVSSMLREFPQLNIDLQLEDRYVDIVAERFDVAVRVTNPVDSTLVARKLTENKLIMVASPHYLKQHGTPTCIEDLEEHNFIVYAGINKAMNRWGYHDGSEIKQLDMKVSLKVNDGYALLKSALDSLGISLTASFISHDAIKKGELVQVLPDIELQSFSPVYLMYPSRSHVPKKTRLFIDKMIEHIGQQAFYQA